MKAAVVLLASREVQNFIRKVVYTLDRQYNRPFLGSVLPAHVSLKQPFTFEVMPVLEDWFDSLAASLPPFEIALEGIYHTSWSGYGILGLNVVETPILRGLHERVNRELAQIVTDPSAAFDGDAYRFHLTIEMGPVREEDIYKTYLDELENKAASFTFSASELGLFYYADRQPGPDSFLVYKVLPLGGKNPLA